MAKKPISMKLAGAGIIILFALVLAGIVWGSYNNLVRLNQNVDKTWADVEAQYQRRVDLIPNLVNVVQGYADFEKSVLTDITNIRSQWQAARSAEQRVDTANQFESALSRLLLISENYPDLKANQNFIALQDSLAETENMVSVARTRYNTGVRDYNSATKVFPSNMVANWFNFRERQYFAAKQGSENAPIVNISIK